MTDELRYHRHMEAIAKTDIDYLRKKDAQYAASWKQRGGVGAFFTIVRPWDRFVNMLDPSKVPGDQREAPIAARLNRPVPAFDLFAAIRADGLVGEDGTVIACVRDLRRYLLLIEAHMTEEMIGDAPHSALDSALTRLDFAKVEERVMAHMSGETGAPGMPGMRTPEEKARQFAVAYGSGTPEDGGHHEPAVRVHPWIVERGQSVMPGCYSMRAKDVWRLDEMVESDDAIPVILRSYYAPVEYVNRAGFATTVHVLKADMMPNVVFDCYYLPLPTEVNDFEIRECKPEWHAALYKPASNGTKLEIRPEFASWTASGRI